MKPLLAAILVFVAPLLLNPSPAFAQQAAAADTQMSAKKKDIVKFLELTGATALARQSIRQMVALYRQSMPDVPASFWDEFEKEADAGELVALLVPVYDQNLSHDDIKALIAFYESPAGKNYTKALPTITAESQKAGQVWGSALGEMVAKRLKEEGHQ